ncbi:MAG: alanine--tRNA ligase [Prevotellaceae bacterium]|jgi:alanyl-tRNA synthetase|nr:alanine--tRNA ligase [Prevotellaceae bacterium]
MNSKQIRSTFLNFFKSKQHTIVPSAPMVIHNDPTLMFTNAGMNQFKDIFLGNAPAFSKRVADTQKCLRVSGKHNDLEEVGRDTYHHTMFEMLGNWSFGDYFKKEAIDWAWGLLVDVFKVSQDRLYATIFEGSKDDGVEMDSEALECWKKYLPKERILMGNKKDNFWEMGDIGPCGPCSEVHIDLRSDEEREKIDGAKLVNTDNPLVIEIWNLVFIQYNRKFNGSLELLPEKHVDTGMGFERLCMALQGKRSNYDTDVFQPIIGEIAKLCGKQYGKNEQVDIAMRVVADHLRAISFSITDGQLPSNVKAGYVIRRILRRAVRYGYTFLDFNEPFINNLVPTLVEQMGEAFPELEKQQTLVEKVIKEEEASFLRTLETGIRLLDSVMDRVKKDGKNEIDGKAAFELYDTYGFPIDLTELIASENGLTVNHKEFQVELEQQKERSRNASAIETEDWVELKKVEQVEFLGYDTTEAEAHITRYRTVKQKGKTLIQLVFDRTPFYGESGGQVGDRGYIESNEEKINILNTIKENNLTIHIAERLPANPGATFIGKVDQKSRLAVTRNHTATHLLHHALRKVLGKHVEQKGSLVHPEYLRFDFSHFQKMTDEEIREVERLVNKMIRADYILDEKRSIPMDDAKEMGAMALFGEKYGDVVRVIKFGDSMELCGGTHIATTGQIGFFKIMSEGAIAAGVRRIEAVTAANAEEQVYMLQRILKEVKDVYNNAPNLMQTIKKTIEESAELRKKVDEFIHDRVVMVKNELVKNIMEINGINVIQLKGENSFPPEAVKELAYMLRNEVNELLFVAGTVINDKPSLTVMLSDSLVKNGLNASNIIREAAKEIQGGGGGQPFFATAGGKNPEGLSAAVAKVIDIVTNI